MITHLSIEEATGQIYSYLAEKTGWKLLKSTRSLKKTVKDLVFEIRFHSSKWNRSHEQVEIKCELQMRSKNLGKTCTTHSHVGFFQFPPPEGYWWDISTETSLNNTMQALEVAIKQYAVGLCERFEHDYNKAILHLLDNQVFDAYHVRLEFVALHLGEDAVIAKAQRIYNSLPAETKSQVKDYQAGDRSRFWMINPSNLRFIIDSGLIDTH